MRNRCHHPFAHTASHVAQTSWRQAEVVGNHYQGRPGTISRPWAFGYGRAKVSRAIESGVPRVNAATQITHNYPGYEGRGICDLVKSFVHLTVLQLSLSISGSRKT